MRISLFIGALALGLAVTGNAASGGGVHMFVRHDVADYAKWRGDYDKFRATQRQMGVSAQAVYKSVDNPNDITVTHVFKSEAAARAFVDSDKLKSAMQASGVVGAPQIWYTKLTPGASGKAGRVRMFVRHDVADYAAWRKAYDEFQHTHSKQMGGGAQAVYQAIDNPNDVTVFSDYSSAEKAKAFAGSADLKSAMQSAGVKGEPKIWFTTRAVK